MNEGKKLLRLLTIGLLAFSLAMAGCSGDDGRDGVDGADGQDFQLPEAQQAGLMACSTCHGTGSAAEGWVQSKHAMNSSHSIATCATECHNPSGAMYEMEAAFGVEPTGTAVGCEDCHGAGSNHVNLPNQVDVANTAPEATVCAQCHDAEGELAHLTHHPFNEQLYTRYAASGHGNSGHGGGFCAACHSHQGGVFNIESGRKTSVQQLFEEYSIDTVPFWAMEEETGLLDMQCATCHDPHEGGLRTSDTVADVTYDDDNDPATPDVTESTVVYSAEFNLCTSCHMIDLDYAPAGHGDAGVLLDYELSDAYSAASLVDATTETFKEVELAPFYNPDGTLRDPRVVYETQVFYHDNTPHGGRNFSDTHFAGDIVGRMAAVEEDETQIDPTAVTDVTLTGYNINAAAVDACTSCHDPHSANKVQAGDDVAQAKSFAEGVGQFHANYLGDAQGHGCQPCHNGGESFVSWVVGGSEPSASTTEVIACRSCHELEQVGQDADGNPVLEDPTVVRAFAEGHEFAFASGVVVDAADLGVNQICFECHKGRTPAPADESTITGPAGQIRDFGYLHYAPSMAILFGDESDMVTTYAGNTYAGKFVHGGGAVAGTAAADFGCVTCHNVHDTDGNDVVQNKMVTSADCAGCHEAGAFYDANILRDRTVAFGQRLLEALAAETVAVETATPGSLDAALAAGLAGPFPYTDTTGDLGGEVGQVYVDAEEVMDIWTHGRTNELPTLPLRKAAEVYKVFNYEDGSPHGTTHGHGGSWAHNSKFARQVQFDAIEALGGDTTGLTRP